MFGGSPEINHRLRSEKSHQQLGRRGFDSRHLHHQKHMAFDRGSYVSPGGS